MIKLVLCITYVMAECPDIVPRSKWRGREPKAVTPLEIQPPPVVVIHHSAGKYCINSSDCESIVRSIQEYHMDTKKWNDIGYNFLIGGDGAVYEGRGFGVTGAHCPKFNGRSLGICLLGNFDQMLPSNQQINVTKKLIKCAETQSYIMRDYHLFGHRQLRNTLCPGNMLFKEITKWPHFDEHPDSL